MTPQEINGYTPDQRDIIERCQQHARMQESEPMPDYMPRLVRAAAWIVVALLVVAGVMR